MPRLVLLYHKIAAGSDRVDDQLRISVSESNFASQVAVLRRRSRIVSLDEWLSTPADDEPSVLVTFDDGYRSSLQLAQMILGEVEAKAVAFISPGHVGMEAPYWWDRLASLVKRGFVSRDGANRLGDELMHLSYEEADRKCRALGPAEDESLECDADCKVSDWSDLREFSGAVFDIAHHGFRHDCFSALPTARLDRDLSLAAAEFATHDVPAYRVLAYPFGFPGSVTINQVRECVALHFQAAFTSVAGVERSGSSLNRLLSSRNYVEDWDSDEFERWLDARLGAART